MTLENFLRSIDRRTFLRLAAFAGVGSFIYPRDLMSILMPDQLSRIVVVEDSSATSGLSINAEVVQVMVDSGIKALAQQEQTGEAWKTLLTGIQPTSRIAIKVNCINSSMSTHPLVTYAVANSLTQMSFGDVVFPENNIIIYDRTNWELKSAGYTENTSDVGVRCFGTETSGIGYSDENYNVNGKNQKISKIITEFCDYLINLSVLKNHSITGVTLCLKNHYGTCHYPDSLHPSYGDPYIPSLNSQDPILSKQVVNICDALFGIKSGGPSGSPQFTANKIILSKDIVSVDYLGRSILADNGCTTVSYADYIDTASTVYGLGTNDPEQMEQITILNPTTAIHSTHAEQQTAPDQFLLRQNYPNPFNNTTRIEFYVAKSQHVILDVFDDMGRRVRRLVNKTVQSGWNQVFWDGTNDYGQQIASGLYISRLRVGGLQKVIITQLIK